MNLLPAVEAYITQRIADLAKFHPHPGDRIDELETVRSLCRGLDRQFNVISEALNPKATDDRTTRGS